MLGQRFFFALVLLTAFCVYAQPEPPVSPAVDSQPGLAAAPESDASDPYADLPALEPASDITLLAAGLHHDDLLAVSPDGTQAIAQRSRQTVNIWQLVVVYWPWWLGVLAGMELLWGAWRVIRTLRRHRSKGRPYCRKCNYDLTGAAGATCPECGADRAGKGTVRGKSRLRQIAPALILALPIPLLYLACWISDPVDSPIIRWFYWPSDALMPEDEPDGSGWVDRAIVNVHEARLVDLRMGQYGRLIDVFDDAFIAARSPDGTCVFLTDCRKRGLEWDWVQGGVTQKLKLPEGPAGGWRMSSDVPRAAYVSPDRVMTEDWEIGDWDLAAGRVRNRTGELRARAAENAAMGDGVEDESDPAYRELLALHCEVGAGIHSTCVEMKQSSSGSFWRHAHSACIVRVSERTGEEWRRFSVVGTSAEDGFIRSADGRLAWFLVRGEKGDRAEAWVADNGVCERTIELHADTDFTLNAEADFIALAGDRLVAGIYDRELVAVYDLKADRWTTKLSTPANIYIRRLLHADENQLIFVGEDYNTNTPKLHIIRYDLRAPATAGK